MYGQTEYLIEKLGEPAAAIISVDDFHLLQKVKAYQKESGIEPKSSFLAKLETIHQTLSAGGYHPRTKEEVEAQSRAG